MNIINNVNISIIINYKNYNNNNYNNYYNKNANNHIKTTMLLWFESYLIDIVNNIDNINKNN